jgi:hypothetical protein
MNPPYGMDMAGNSNLRQFFAKLEHEYEHGEVSQAIALLIAKTDTSWFKGLWHYPLCFMNHKVHFSAPALFGRARLGIQEDVRDTHMFGTVIVYMGAELERFTHAYAPYGHFVFPLHYLERRREAGLPGGSGVALPPTEEQEMIS